MRHATASETQFWLLSRVRAMNVVTVARLRSADGAPSRAALTQALSEVRAAIPLARVRFRELDGRLWVEEHDAPIPLACLDAPVDTTDDDEAAWRPEAEKWLQAPLEDGLVAVATIGGGSPRREVWWLLVCTHHAIADARSGAMLAEAIVRALGADAPAPTTGEEPGAAAPLPVWWRDLRASGAWQSRIAHATLPPPVLAALLARCRERSVSVNSLICAATMQIWATGGGEGPIPVSCSCAVDLRSRLTPPATGRFGLHAAEVSVTLPMRRGADVWAVASDVQRRVAAALDPEALLGRRDRALAFVLGASDAGQIQAGLDAYAPLRIGVSNLGRIAPTEGPHGWESLHFVAGPPIRQSLLSITTLADTLSMNLTFPEPGLGGELARTRLQTLRDRLVELGRPSVAAPRPAPVPERGPLSWGQRAMWLHAALAPTGAAYTLPIAATVPVGTDIPCFLEMFELLIERHPSLRTRFPPRGGDPEQDVLSRVTPPVERSDAGAWTETRLGADIDAFLALPFDLARAPCWRARLYVREGRPSVLVLALHHIIGDMASAVLLVRDLEALYAARMAGQAPPPAPRRSPVEFAHWQERLLKSPRGKASERFWLDRLRDVPVVLELPTDLPRAPVPRFRGHRVAFELAPEPTARLMALARAEGVTPFAVILTAFAVLMARFTGQRHFALGIPTAGREEAEWADVVGDFINPVALPVDLRDDPGVRVLLQRMQSATAAAVDHQAYPFPLLVEKLAPRRDPSRSPVFQVLLNFHNQLASRSAPGAYVLGRYDVDAQGAQVDLALDLAPRDGGLAGAWTFDTDLFLRGTIESLDRHLHVLLDALSGVDAPVSTLPLYAPDDRSWCVDGPPVPVGPDSLGALLGPRLADAAGVAWSGGAWTGRDLDAMSARVARRLAEAGAKPGDRIGLLLDLCPELVPVLLGVVRAGCAWVPVDPSHPPARNALIIEDADLRLLVARRTDATALGAFDVEHLLAGDTAPDVPWALPDGDATAYVIYTSGSTGRPKGVAVPHRAVAGFLRGFVATFGVGQGDVLLALTTPSFDISILELLVPLVSGGRLEIPDPAARRDGAAVGRLVDERRVTLLQATPSAWRLLTGSGLRPSPGLRRLCGGEALPASLAAELRADGGSLINLYGPTEATIWCLADDGAVVSDGAPPPIGRPLPGVRVAVVDAALRPVPRGAVGELVVGGPCLATGYLNRPDLTATAFVPSVFDRDERMYRTGDHVRRRDDGRFAYVGRADDQVKVRGFRVELAEVEACMGRHPGVTRAAAAMRTRPNGSEARAPELFGWYSGSVTPDALRDWAAGQLPPYMVPSALYPLDSLPMTPNEKLDRNALVLGAAPVPVRSVRAAGIDAVIVEIWEQALGCAVRDLDRNFFELGGHSLLLPVVRGALAERLGVDLPLVTLFEHTTVRALAEHLERRDGVAG